MTEAISRQTLLHPQLGTLRARRVLDCVFALHPEGPILHLHVDDMEIRQGADGVQYILQERPPAAAHARCRVIPPRVPEF